MVERLPASSKSIIDDFELKPLRQSQDEDLHDLIAERYERASALVGNPVSKPKGKRNEPKSAQPPFRDR